MLQAIQLGRTGDLTGSDAVVWQVDEATPYVPSPILYDGRIYVCSVNNEIISSVLRHEPVDLRLPPI